MKRPSENNSDHQEEPEGIRGKLMGLGARSMRKSYYPELKKRMTELEQAGGYLRSIVDAMPSMLVGVNDRLEITLLNATAAEIAGIAPDAAWGKPLGHILPWLSGLSSTFAAVMADGLPRTLRKLPDKNQDATKWYDATVFPLGQGRNEVVARVDDVTSRVRMEEMLMQTEKRLSVGALAAGMAHEINNPLAGILQGVQSVLRRLGPNFEANQKAAAKAGLDLEALAAYMADRGISSMLGSIRESGVRAARIVSNILEFSRRSDMSKAQVPLAQMVDKALELAVSEFDLKKKYDFRHIRITRFDESTLPSVWCVPTQIEQVILNLLKNAAHALTASGTAEPSITIRTGWCDAMACIQVQDNGPGMDEATRERVFEPFFTTKRSGEGTGLGLSVVYYIVVEQHGGRVAVDSAPEKGTTVSIMIPVDGPAIQADKI